jgi:hypothetical protein
MEAGDRGRSIHDLHQLRGQLHVVLDLASPASHRDPGIKSMPSSASRTVGMMHDMDYLDFDVLLQAPGKGRTRHG